MEDLIKLLEILIWPIVAVLGIVLFRQQIGNLIPNIKKIRKGDSEIVFEYEVKSINNRFKANGSKFSDIDIHLIKDNYGKLMAIAKFNQRKALIETWEVIDNAIYSKVAKHYPDIAAQKYISTEYRGKSLLKEGMSPSDIEAIRILAELKNTAMSSDVLSEDEDAINSYIENTLKAAYYINNVL